MSTPANSTTPEPTPTAEQATEQAPAAAEPPKRRRSLIGLEVIRRESLSPSMVRVVLGGEGFAAFADNGFTDQYVKLQFFPDPAAAQGATDLGELKDALPKDQRPVSRTYTVRWVDHESKKLAIDFVVHGDQGLAGPWAATAQPGDLLYFSGPGGKFSPSPDADFHLFCGDESALPAIAAALAALPRDAVGAAFLEVDGNHNEQRLSAPAGVEVTWLHRDGAETGTTEILPQAVSALPWPTGQIEAFIHGERGAVKALRDVVLKQRGLPKDQVSISGYWAHGRVEDAFQAEKRLPIGQI